MTAITQLFIINEALNKETAKNIMHVIITQSHNISCIIAAIIIGTFIAFGVLLSYVDKPGTGLAFYVGAFVASVFGNIIEGPHPALTTMIYISLPLLIISTAQCFMLKYLRIKQKEEARSFIQLIDRIRALEEEMQILKSSLKEKSTENQEEKH